MTGSPLRAILRIGWRDIAGHKRRSLLVALLVLLPVAAMVFGISLFRTMQPTPEREDVARMGGADLNASGASLATLEGALPAGSVFEPVTTADGRLVLPGYRPNVQLQAVDIEGLAAGMITLVDGRAPSGPEEVAVTEAVADLAGVTLGGQLPLEDHPNATVVGIVENPTYLRDRLVVFDPQAVTFGSEEDAYWLIDLPAGVDPEAVVAATTDPVTGEQPYILQSRRSGRIGMVGADSASASILILGALALVESSLIASAAFAVSIRRRQRELGLLAAIGATPRQLGATVLAEAAILGLIACAGGVLVGAAGAAVLYPFLDDLVQRRNGPLIIDTAGTLVPVLIGLIAALVAGIVPARTVARVSVLLALSGRRPPEAGARRTLAAGMVAIAAAAAMTVVGATMRNAGSDMVSILLLVGGAVLSVLGFGACGPWLLERLGGIAVRLPLAGRIAFRDTARARSRSSPIVTAILAGCAAAIALGAWTTSRDQENLAGWAPALYPDEVYIAGAGAVAAGEDLQGRAGIAGGAPVDVLVPEDPEKDFVSYELADARDSNGKAINLAEACIAQGNCEPDMVIRVSPGMPSRATPELLALVHVESQAAAIAADLAAGRAVVLTSQDITATTLRIMLGDQLEMSGEVTTIGEPEHVETIDMPVRVIVVPVPGGVLPDFFLPDATIARLPLVPMSEAGDYGEVPYIVQFDHPVTDADLAGVRQVAATYPETSAVTMSAPERPGQEFRFVLIALVLVFALSVMGVALALGEAESRPEQRSLLALGADPRLRRRIVASRAAVLALLAGVLSVPAGLLPIWGIFVSRGSAIAVPTIEIAGAVVVLPVLAVVISWLLSRPIPDWAAFRTAGARD